MRATQLDFLEADVPAEAISWWAEWGPPGDETSKERLVLHGRWADGGTVVFIGLNPSTATGIPGKNETDPTIRRDLGFARAIGAGSLMKLNIYAFRATDPNECKRAVHGTVYSNVDNDKAIERVVASPFVTHVIACWGAKEWAARRGEEVQRLVTKHRPLYALRVTQKGFPEHPLYLPGKCRPVIWRERR